MGQYHYKYVLSIEQRSYTTPATESRGAEKETKGVEVPLAPIQNRLTVLVGQALKIKIEELKASNLELQAFKESHPRASRRGSAGSGLLSPKLRPPPDSSNGICQGSGSAPQDSAHQLLWDDENLAHMSTLHTCLPCLEKDFLNDLTINTNVNFDSADTNATADTRFRQYPPSNSESESVGEAWEASQPPNGYWSRSRDSMGQITVLQLQSSDALDDLMNSRGREMAGLEKEPGITESRPSSAAARVARLDRSDKSQRAMKVAVTNRQTAMVKLLIHHGVSVNAQDESRRTVLHDATEANDAKTVQLLLENGADSNVVDASGMTALELAASLGNVEVAKVLLKEGAD
ncbi:MAG: hypothetical protein M1818_005598 [Claussenomyces sp. TS43310]|nr:MAG: hypothetical protein M1818_005598 [Claussenomyces sp. TS43310]